MTEYEIPEIAATERFCFMHGRRAIRPGLYDRLTGCRIYIREYQQLGRSGLDAIAAEMNAIDRSLSGEEKWTTAEATVYAQAEAVQA